MAAAAQAQPALGGIDEAQVLVDQGIAGALAEPASPLSLDF
jgi:hypothetical protein